MQHSPMQAWGLQAWCSPQGLFWIMFGVLQSPAVVHRDEVGAQFVCWW